MARQQSQKTVSLFPFLAVLVCTMGALILLLLVTTRRIRQDAQTQANTVEVVLENSVAAETTVFDGLDEIPGLADSFEPLTIPSPAFNSQQPAEPSAQPVPKAEITDVAIRLTEISSSEAIANDQRETVAALQQEMEQLRKRIAEEEASNNALKLRVKNARTRLTEELAAQPEDDGHDVQQLQELEGLLAEQLERGQQRLAELQAALEDKSATTESAEKVLRARESDLASLREYVRTAEAADGTDTTIVDFTNSTGTERAPIVIDVTERGYRFLPAGVNVSPKDMLGFPANDNPLLAGVMAVHEQRHPGSLTVKPYVLMLVRPTGSLLFYSAQRTLLEGGIHFGYELVEETRSIATGQTSPNEPAALQQSIQEALERRERLYGFDIAKLPTTPTDRPQNQAEKGGERRFRVMPDGRVMSEDEANEGHDGRYFAGGEAKPPKFSDAFQTDDLMPPTEDTEVPVAGESEPADTESAFAENTTSPANETAGQSVAASDAFQSQVVDAGQMIAEPEVADRVSNPWAEGRWDQAIDNRTAAGSETAGNGENPFSQLPDFAAIQSRKDGDDGQMPEFKDDVAEQLNPDGNPAGLVESDNTKRRSTEQPIDNSIAGQSTESARWDQTPSAGIRASDFLRRSGAISGNLGVGGDRFFDLLAAEPTEQQTLQKSLTSTEITDTVNPENTSEGWADGLNETADAAANPNPASAADVHEFAQAAQFDKRPAGDNIFSSSANPHNADRTDSPERSDWSEAASADALTESRPVGPPENQTLDTPSFPGGAGQSSSPDGQGGTAAVTDSQQYVLKHQGQQPTQPQNGPVADPVLQSLLRTAISNDPEQAGYYPVTVHIHRESLEVGSFQRIDTKGWDHEQIVEMVLEALSAEVLLLPSAEQSGVVPTIDYVVGPAAGRIQQRVEVVLNRMKVPTRTIINVADDAADTNRSPQSDAVSPPTSKAALEVNDVNVERRRSI